MQNTGLILVELQPQDYVFGASTVKHTINIGGVEKWLSYFSDGELQIGTYYDTMSCVTFSALNVVEALFNYLIKKGSISRNNLSWLKEKGYIVDGKMNLSDRFTSVKSGTTPNGNTGANVAYSIRHDGVIPESMFSWNKGRDIPYIERFINFFLNKDKITQEMTDLGLEFVKRFDINYEVVFDKDFVKALEHSPIQIFISTNCPVVNDIEQTCSLIPNHAVTLIDNPTERGYYPIFDHYIENPEEKGQERFIRKMSKDYKFYKYGYSFNVTEKKEEPVTENTMLKTVKGEKSSAIYAVGVNGELSHISSMETLEEGHRLGLWDKNFETKKEDELKKMPSAKSISFLL